MRAALGKLNFRVSSANHIAPRRNLMSPLTCLVAFTFGSLTQLMCTFLSNLNLCKGRGLCYLCLNNFPDISVGTRICLQCRRPQFSSWVGKICWRRDRLPNPVFLGFPCVSAGKEIACNAGDLGSITGLGRSTNSSILVWRIPWTV